MNTSKANRYNGIDLFKFIFSFFVVMIHLMPLSALGNKYQFISEVITRIAVPFFFCASGFLLKNKLDNNVNGASNNKIVLQYIIRILMLYLIWTIIYLPCIIFWYINDEETILGFIKKSIFDGTYLHLWYLPALSVAIIFVYVLYNKTNAVITISITAGLYIIGLFDHSWYNLFDNQYVHKVIDIYDEIFITSRNGIFFGAIFIAIGFFVKDYRLNLKKSIYGCIVSWLFVFIEMYIYRKFHIFRTIETTVFIAVLAFFIFNLALNIQLKDSTKYKIIRNAGTLIYFGHCWVDFTFSIVQYNILHRTFNSLVRFGYTIAITVPLAFLVVFLQKKKGLKWLNKLY